VPDSNSDEDKDAAAHRARTVLGSGLPTGDEIGLTSGFHNLTSKERIEEVTERGNEDGRASSVMGRNMFG
jgi:hypothetical protein